MYILHLAFKLHTTFLRLSLSTHIAPVHFKCWMVFHCMTIPQFFILLLIGFVLTNFYYYKWCFKKIALCMSFYVHVLRVFLEPEKL